MENYRVSQIIQAQADIMKKAGGGGAGAPGAPSDAGRLRNGMACDFSCERETDGVENLTVAAAAERVKVPASSVSPRVPSRARRAGRHMTERAG